LYIGNLEVVGSSDLGNEDSDCCGEDHPGPGEEVEEQLEVVVDEVLNHVYIIEEAVGKGTD
jgi:hypothetical protein